jgi:hypothetical protein
MPKRKKGYVLPPPARPIPYWLAFDTFVDGRDNGRAKVTFRIDSGSPDLGKAAMALLGRRLFEVPENFSFKFDGKGVDCEVWMSGFDFTIFDVAEKKQQAEEFFSKVVSEADKVLTLVKFTEKN